MSSNHHNPERKAWKGRSYRKGGKRIKALRAAIELKGEALLERSPPDEGGSGHEGDPDNSLDPIV
jgi:hypothetical protein